MKDSPRATRPFHDRQANLIHRASIAKELAESRATSSVHTEWLAKWHMGRVSLGNAMRSRLITIEGARQLVREFSSWGGLTPFASVTPARTEAPAKALSPRAGGQRGPTQATR